jgi:transposase
MEAQLARFAVDVTEAAAKIQKVEGERDEYRKLVLHLREEVERLRRGLLGQKAERLPRDDGQLSLAILTLAMAGAGGAPEAEAAIEEQLVGEHKRRKPVRKPPPADLPRVKIVLTPPEVEREPEAFEQIGSDVREVLERRPAATIVVQVEYLKFVRKAAPKDGEPTRVLVVPALELPIERGTAGPGLLADTIVKRWQDHQPLNRLEGIYGREGLDLSRSTICTWHEQLAPLAAPVVEAMFADALAQPYVCVDATGVLVLAKDKCKNGHFWVLVAPERHVLYRYSRRHDSAAVDALLPDYRGYVVADAHNVYDHLYRQAPWRSPAGRTPDDIGGNHFPPTPTGPKLRSPTSARSSRSSVRSPARRKRSGRTSVVRNRSRCSTHSLPGANCRSLGSSTNHPSPPRSSTPRIRRLPCTASSMTVACPFTTTSANGV